MIAQKLIGITGAARSGKDTVASFLLSLRGGYLYSFADPIREMLKALGVDLSDPYWQDRKELTIKTINASPRRMMQTLGTEWGRELIHPDLWVLLAAKKLKANGQGMIVTDVRFENEAAFVRDNDGVLIHVTRTNGVLVEAHKSENGVKWDQSDRIIRNNGSLDELYVATRNVLDVA